MVVIVRRMGVLVDSIIVGVSLWRYWGVWPKVFNDYDHHGKIGSEC